MLKLFSQLLGRPRNLVAMTRRLVLIASRGEFL
jgi:hypothetical protein